MTDITDEHEIEYGPDNPHPNFEETTICPDCKDHTVIDEYGWTCCAEVTDPEWYMAMADRLHDEMKECANADQA